MSVGGVEAGPIWSDEIRAIGWIKQDNNSVRTIYPLRYMFYSLAGSGGRVGRGGSSGTGGLLGLGSSRTGMSVAEAGKLEERRGVLGILIGLSELITLLVIA